MVVEKLMMAPPLRTRRAACWLTMKVPRTLVRCIRSKSARSSSASGDSSMIPAVFTSTSIPS